MKKLENNKQENTINLIKIIQIVILLLIGLFLVLGIIYLILQLAKSPSEKTKNGLNVRQNAKNNYIENKNINTNQSAVIDQGSLAADEKDIRTQEVENYSNEAVKNLVVVDPSENRISIKKRSIKFLGQIQLKLIKLELNICT